MIAPRNPKRGLTLHPVPPRNAVLNGVGQSMPDMQGAGNIRWWDDHDELFLLWAVHGIGGLRREEFLLLPPGLPEGLYELGVVVLWEGLSVVTLPLNLFLQCLKLRDLRTRDHLSLWLLLPSLLLAALLLPLVLLALLILFSLLDLEALVVSALQVRSAFDVVDGLL